MAATNWQAQLRASLNTNRPRRSKREDRKRSRKPRSKPAWDDTSSDLTAYKPSPNELARRHEIHKPKPMADRKYLQLYQEKLFQDEKENIFTRKIAFPENFEKKKAIIKEIFHNQEKELQDVLVETDRTMAEVKDLFGDDPLKFKAIPHVTAAPNLAEDEHGHIEYFTYVFWFPTVDRIRSHLDLDYYKNLLHREQNRESDYEANVQSNPIEITNNPNLDRNGDRQSMQGLDTSSVIVKPSIIMTCSDSNSEYPQGTREKFSSDVVGGAPGTSVLQGGNFGKFNQLKEVLGVLERELSTREQDSKVKQDDTPISHVDDTASLVDIMIKLIQHLRQNQLQVQVERAMYENLLLEFEEQKTLVDALTGDLINTQQQNCLLLEEFEKFKLQTNSELQSIKDEMRDVLKHGGSFTKGICRLFDQIVFSQHDTILIHASIPPIPQAIKSRRQHFVMLRICVVGSGGVGKSCVTLRYLKNEFTEYYDPTMEETYQTEIIYSGKSHEVEIVDTAGQEEFTSFLDSSLATGDAFMVLYAINSLSSWNDLKSLRSKICQETESTKKVPMIVVGNKRDLENERISLPEDPEDYAASINVPYIETSAKTGFNVKEAFCLMFRQIDAIQPDLLCKRKKNTIRDKKTKDCIVV
eukprot:gene8119-8989_t